MFGCLSHKLQGQEEKCECRVTKITGGIKRDMRETEGEKCSWSTAPEKCQALLAVAEEIRSA